MRNHINILLLVITLSPSLLLAAGSMRIEVEVYNGPLSKELAIQQEELRASIEIAKSNLALLVREVHLSQCSLGCFGSLTHKEYPVSHDDAYHTCNTFSEADDNIVYERIKNLVKLKNPGINDEHIKNISKHIFPETTAKQYQYMLPPKRKRGGEYHIPIKHEDSLRQVCPVLTDIKLNMTDLLSYIFAQGEEPLPESTDYTLNQKKYALYAGRIGKLLAEGAEHWSTTQIAILLQSTRARINVSRAVINAAELGNEISARADAIYKQLAGGINHGTLLRQELSTSAYLRDAEGTDYLNIVDWLNAYPKRNTIVNPQNFGIESNRGRTSQWKAVDRTRMIERLITDSNWSKINTVFAQGKGDVNMAFIKDDVGNWNLKSYDNDPSKLLKAYTDFGSKLLVKAAKLATGASSLDTLAKNAQLAQQVNSNANGVTFGTGDNGQTSGIAAALNTSLAKRLTTIAINHKREMQRLADNLNIEGADENDINGDTRRATSATLENIRETLITYAGLLEGVQAGAVAQQDSPEK